MRQRRPIIEKLVLTLLLFLGPTLFASDESELKLFLEARELFYSDLHSFSQLKFQDVSPWHQMIFGDSAVDLGNFVRERMQGLAWSVDEKSNVVAHGVPGAPLPGEPLPWPLKYYLNLSEGTLNHGTIVVSANYLQLKWKSPLVLRQAILLHEARHAESAVWSHVFCPIGYVFSVDGKQFDASDLNKAREVGIAACDSTSFGSYAVQYAFLRSVEETCTTCGEKMKMDAGLYTVSEGLMRIADETEATRLLYGASKDPRAGMAQVEALMTPYSSETPVKSAQ